MMCLEPVAICNKAKITLIIIRWWNVNSLVYVYFWEKSCIARNIAYKLNHGVFRSGGWNVTFFACRSFGTASAEGGLASGHTIVSTAWELSSYRLCNLSLELCLCHRNHVVCDSQSLWQRKIFNLFWRVKRFQSNAELRRLSCAKQEAARMDLWLKTEDLTYCSAAVWSEEKQRESLRMVVKIHR